MDVTLPNGYVIQGVPEGTTKDEIKRKAIAAGYAQESDFSQVADEQPMQSFDAPVIYDGEEVQQSDYQSNADDSSFGEKALGVGEAALTALTGATGGTIGLIGGALKGIASEIRSGNFGTAEAADRIEQHATKIMQDFTYAPRTEKGREYVQDIGEVAGALTPLAGLGGEMAQISSMAQAAKPQIVQTAKPVVQVAKKAAAPTVQAVKPVGEIAKGVFTYQSPTKQKIAALIEQGVPATETAKYKLIEGPKSGAGASAGTATSASKIRKILALDAPKVAKDTAAIETIKQGFDEGVIASVKMGSKTDKLKMAKMVDLMETGKKNKEFAVRNRPSDVAGDSLMERVRAIRSINSKAGADLNVVAGELKGKAVDSSPAVNKFLEDLQGIGVTVGDDLKPVFYGSDIEGVAGAENVIKNIVNRMKNTKTPDGYDIHRLKKYIDEQVTYGKTTEGLAGKTELILKKLRRNLDGILDNQFPEYDRVNTTYKDTIDALDALQDVAGRKMDLSGGSADKATGTLLRRLMSNAQSRVRLLDSLDEIETVAGKYGAKFDDNLIAQALFVDELDRVFGPVARTSFQGQIEQAIDSAARMSTSPTGLGDAALKGAAKGAEKLRGINEQNAFKAIRKLLNDQNQNQ